STYVAAYNALIGLSQFTGPILGGVAADLFGARPVFLASTLIRLAAWWAFAYRLKTAHERPVTWRDFIPVSAGALKRLPHEAAQLPGRVVRRLRARLLERRLRQKMERRRVETALQEALKQGEPGASGDDPSEQDQRPGAGPGVHGRPFRITVVEDDEKLASVLAGELERFGYDVVRAVDPGRVKEEFMALKPDLVLLDINLPRYDGFYWCRQIRTLSKVPIIFIS